MSKNIVIITGSPRKNGNTRILTDAFFTSLQKNHAVKYFHAADMKIGACKACDACYKNGKACAFSDDFNQIMDAIEPSDIVVFASPLYWYSFSAQMKMVIDKLYSATVVNKNLSGKESILISIGADNDIHAFDAMIFSYRKSIQLLGWTSQKEIIIPNLLEAGAILKTNHIQEIETFAQQLK